MPRPSQKNDRQLEILSVSHSTVHVTTRARRVSQKMTERRETGDVSGPETKHCDEDVFVSESSASGLRDTVNVSRDQGRIISRASTQQKQSKQQRKREADD
ncbi:hypothetical protein DPX16_4078 [Anabarilius grahami]|uniref:Uncharacterized protein n=1 Tax=Anabarilius grahami TaxID=495550 RepID=A0A3N0XYG2_ANAGA|nr:hypothetical protein DPX16_4078 [Anabarilius grahami]